MNNEIQRKLTSLTLMSIMLAGGMTIAAPGFMPAAHAANANLYVSAEDIGNFAGIQVIEIVVDDPVRSDTDGSEGRPNVEINNKDVFMVQGTGGNWYGYVANEIAINAYSKTNAIYDADKFSSLSDTDAKSIYGNATAFLDGSKDYNPKYHSKSGIAGTGTIDQHLDNWPFIQTYDISENSDVTIRYGTGGTAQAETIKYDYDDDKDITLDRSKYPQNSQIFIDLDDSLLNLSPTADESWVFYENGTIDYVIDTGSNPILKAHDITWEAIGFENGPLVLNNGANVMQIVDTGILDSIKETNSTNGQNTGDSSSVILRTHSTIDNLFVNYDNADKSGLKVIATGNANIEYDSSHSVVSDTFNGAIDFVVSTIVDEWLSGVPLDIELVDEDRNLTSRTDETLDILDDEVPYIKIGSPITIDTVNTIQVGNGTDIINVSAATDLTASLTGGLSVIENATSIVVNATWNYQDARTSGYVLNYINYDFTSLGGQSGTFKDGETPIGVNTDNSNSTLASYNFTINTSGTTGSDHQGQVYFDIFSFGQVDAIADSTGDISDNVDRVNDAFYRFVLEETDDNTAKFKGSVEYIMINQLNVFDQDTYDSIETADKDVVIIVNDDMDGSDSVTVSYQDIDSTTSSETISVQEEANTHSGKISIDKESYSSGNTITVTLVDADLNTDSDTIQSYDVNDSQDWVGNSNVWLSQMTISDTLFDDSCSQSLGLFSTGFTLEESAKASGIFVGTLKLPSIYCTSDSTNSTTNGLDIDFTYQDYNDASGKPNETSADATIRSNTGTVELDRTTYPVPFGESVNALYDTVYLTHDEGGAPAVDADLGKGTVIVTIQVNDPDYNISASGEDTIPTSTLKLVIARGSIDQEVTILESNMVEITPESGIFEVDVEIDQGIFTESPEDDKLIYQGDILTVTYTDPNDASGDINTITDSATFDMRNAVIQTDKLEYIIGSDAIITLIEPDLNLDSGTAETWSLDIVNWDSAAGQINISGDEFDVQPRGFRETGDDTGIFQTVMEIPKTVEGDNVERGERITLEYQDNSPAGADFIGDDTEDISIDIRSSDYGASVSLDQKVYTWTDKVYLTIVAPDHNFDSKAIDEIGGKTSEININTRADEIEFYKLVETGADTGIFTGEIILTGFENHDADGDGEIGDATGDTIKSTSSDQAGPTNGLLETKDDDGLTITFENSDGDIAHASALIRWNIGEVQWLQASYSAASTGIVRVIDPDMNMNPESVNSFDVNIWSDTTAGGISLRVTETNEATGIFEGTVQFTTTDASSGSRLSVQEGDTVTAQYKDRTLPEPHSTSDEMSITATTLIGTLVPALERVPAANLRAVDAFSNSIDTIKVDQQVQVTSDIANNQVKVQKFAYLVQIQDKNGVTVSLAWLTGELQPEQTFSPAISWIAPALGDYDATVFVWESVDNPTALSPPLKTTLKVNS